MHVSFLFVCLFGCSVQEIARLNAYQERTQAKWSREMEALQSQVGRDSDLKQRHEEALLRMSQEYEERRKAAERKADDSFREERRSAEARYTIHLL